MKELYTKQNRKRKQITLQSDCGEPYET